jgi:3',5'-cyclic-AMP phosphodiesterase
VAAAVEVLMVTRTIAHISDLHIGRDAPTDARVASLASTLLASDVDQVLLTGDITHKGRHAELDHFERLFGPLRSRLCLVPGNHDRAGDDVTRRLMPGPRVQAELVGGLFVVRVDSTAPHNKSLFDAHGELTPADLAEVDHLVGSAPRGALVVLMLHHHVLPLPFDHVGERLISMLGWPVADELALGEELTLQLSGRCDFVLHGHRHALAERRLASADGRTLRVLNAGSTPELGRARLIVHASGRVLSEGWLHIGDHRLAEPARRSVRAGPASAAA